MKPCAELPQAKQMARADSFPHTVALLLAAGESRRMGRPKQLIKFEGLPLIARTIESILESGVSRIVVVLGAHRELIRPICKAYPVEVVINENWQSGMGSSVKCGAIAVRDRFEKVERMIVCLGDLPFVVGKHYSQLLAVSGENREAIVAAEFRGILAAPMVFPKRYFPLLERAEGDAGVGRIVRGGAGGAVGVPMMEASLDWDVPEDIK